jgi:hypothetical protein
MGGAGGAGGEGGIIAEGGGSGAGVTGGTGTGGTVSGNGGTTANGGTSGGTSSSGGKASTGGMGPIGGQGGEGGLGGSGGIGGEAGSGGEAGAPPACPASRRQTGGSCSYRGQVCTYIPGGPDIRCTCTAAGWICDSTDCPTTQPSGACTLDAAEVCHYPGHQCSCVAATSTWVCGDG